MTANHHLLMSLSLHVQKSLQTFHISVSVTPTALYSQLGVAFVFVSTVKQMPFRISGRGYKKIYIYMGHSPENWTKEGAAFPIK